MTVDFSWVLPRIELLEQEYDSLGDAAGLEPATLNHKTVVGKKLKELYALCRVLGTSAVPLQNWQKAVSAVLCGDSFAGSCVVIDGVILTARHAVKEEDSSDVQNLIAFSQSVTCIHDVLELDLAILQFQQPGQPVPGSLPLLPSDVQPQQGDAVLLISFPATVYQDIHQCEEEPVISQGIISGLSKDAVSGLTDVRMCTPGSSGGALIKCHPPYAGHIIGIHLDLCYHLEDEKRTSTAFARANNQHKGYGGVFITPRGIWDLLCTARNRQPCGTQAIASQFRVLGKHGRE